MRVAIVYDRVNKIGGAERVLESLRDMFPGSTLYTSIYNKKKTPWAKNFTIKTSFIQKIPLINLRHEVIPYLMPFAFESFEFNKFSLIISVTSEASKGIIVPVNTPHVCICLTPTRYLWSGYDKYFKNRILRFLTIPIVWYLRRWDILASERPDAFIAISRTVSSRIKKYYKRKSAVIYPPSDRLFKKNLESIKIPEKDYFLVVSRLVGYKRVDLAVKACTKLKLPLIVIGEGNEYEKLTAIAGENVIFKGRQSDSKLISYYKNCRAFLFPGEEDFGITMVEAQFAGKPVIAYKAGGAVEIIKEGVTGTFFKEQTVDSLCNTLKKFKKSRYNEKDCKKNARRFTEEKFSKQLLTFLKVHKYI
jgi:glycosyltransferase involved in cell wall biosynthesis